MVHVYNIEGHRCVGSYTELSFRSHACSWHPEGVLLAVALKDGKIVILEWDQAGGTLTPLPADKQPQQKRDFTKMQMWPETGGLDELRFSPDGTLLAVGSHSEGLLWSAVHIGASQPALTQPFPICYPLALELHFGPQAGTKSILSQ